MEGYVGEGVLREDQPPLDREELPGRPKGVRAGAKRLLKALVIGLLVQHWIFLETHFVPSLGALFVSGLPYTGWLLPYLVDRLAFYCLVASIFIMLLPWMVISKRWQPELNPQQRSTLSRIFSYVKPHWPIATALSGSIVADSLLDLVPPAIISYLVVGRVILNQDLAFLPWAVMLLAIVFGGKQISNFLKEYLSASLGQKTIHKLRTDAYEHIESLPVRFFDASRTGELISRVVNDTGEIEKVLTDEIAELVADVVVVAGAIVVLFVLAPTAAMYVVPVSILIVVVVNTFKRAIKRSAGKVREAFAELTARGFEVLSGIRIVKSFRMEAGEAQEFHDRSMMIAKAKVHLGKLAGIYGSTVDLLTSSTLLVVVLVTAPPAIADPKHLIPVFMAFMSYLDRLFKPLVKLSKVNITLQKAIAAADRVFEVMDLPPEVQNPSSGLQPSEIEARIEFDHVSFGYRPGQNVLENFSLAIEPGETVAVVGSSGAGKSTVVNLLLRFYEPTAGKILLGGYPIDSLSLRYLRSKIGLVLQEPVLFSGSVRENIRFGNPTSPDEEIIAAAKSANAHDFIASLPKGYDTVVGERGVNLSVGQRQRIAIARALLKNPSILIFDEATSNIDSESESLIQDALHRLAGQRTMIVIGHRLSSIMDADRIVVLEDGGIVEVGTHEDLIDKGGRYSRLYEAQIDRSEPREVREDELVEEDATRMP